MKKKLLFTLLALSLGSLLGGSGAMAQNGWDAIYSQTQTTSKSWTALSESSTKGKVLGASGAVKEPMPTVVRAQVLVLN